MEPEEGNKSSYVAGIASGGAMRTECRERIIHVLFDVIVANYLLRSSLNITNSIKMFSATYLIWHGVVKVCLVTASLLKQRWAYPSAIIAFYIFLAYQLYRYSHTHSLGLLSLLVIDAMLIALTLLEYRRLRALHAFS